MGPSPKPSSEPSRRPSPLEIRRASSYSHFPASPPRSSSMLSPPLIYSPTTAISIPVPTVYMARKGFAFNRGRGSSCMLIVTLLTVAHLLFWATRVIAYLGREEGSPAWAQLDKRSGGSSNQLSFLGESEASPIHIVFTTTAAYTIGLIALLNSTLVSASPSTRERLRFHLVSSTLDEASRVATQMKDRFSLSQDQVSTYGLDDFQDSRLQGITVWGEYRAASLSQPIVFARFLFASLLPNDLDKVIYLDQDTLVRKDLAPLWDDVDLEGHPIAAARLCREGALWRRQFVMNHPLLKDRGFDHDTCTANNGVLVYNLTAWRESDPPYVDQLLDWTVENSKLKMYTLGSQPPTNLVFYRNYKVLDDTWNLMDIAGLREASDAKYRPYIPKTRTRDEVESAAVLHWNGVVKPWACGGEGNYAELWTSFFPDFQDFLPNNYHAPPECDEVVVTKPAEMPSVEQFTVVIVSFARVDTVLKIVKRLQRSPYVKEIVIGWNNLDVPCPAELVALPWVRCMQQQANLVHNRFLVWENITTEAVLHHDDDLFAPLEDLEAAFHIWKDHREQVVGFEPRVIECLDEPETSVSPASLPLVLDSQSAPAPKGCNYRFKLKRGHFDVVIGKLFFVSRTLMKAYFDYDSLVELSSRAPCEDIAMSFLAAHHGSHGFPDAHEPAPSRRLWSPPFPRPPILFKSNLTEISSKLYAGLSQGIKSEVWRDQRHECVQALVDIFGGKPGAQHAYYERDEVKLGRIYKLPVRDELEDGWCSDTAGSRKCRQP